LKRIPSPSCVVEVGGRRFSEMTYRRRARSWCAVGLQPSSVVRDEVLADARRAAEIVELHAVLVPLDAVLQRSWVFSSAPP